MVSIHAPRVGSDGGVRVQNVRIRCFNPRSPCGERLKYPPLFFQPNCFNPRSPCGERLGVPPRRHFDMPFQSTLPVWGATHGTADFEVTEDGFNPRSPCGERHSKYDCGRKPDSFNPRSPCGERHAVIVPTVMVRVVSIHAPRVGSDICLSDGGPASQPFQSTLPVWGATPIPV